MAKTPPESVELARKIITGADNEPDFNPIINVTAAVRDWILEMDYGVGEALTQGRTMRYPHEINGQLNCGDAGIVTYIVAKVAGFNPRIFRVEGYNGLDAVHFIVDLPIEGQRLLTDSFFYEFGSVKYFDDHLEIHRAEQIGGMARCITLGVEDDDDDDVRV